MIIIVIVSCYVIALLWAVVKTLTIGKSISTDIAQMNGICISLTPLTHSSWWDVGAACILASKLSDAAKEKQNALKASTMAHQAHIKMLRYQLNPHFLFNTLNAISTLILLKENDTAEAMVSRLSDFLRYSLDNDPIKRVPLGQEIKALRLYLEIEKVRFDDRLEVLWDIDESCESALVPSMILQPIIENAIKHAISKMENGGRISITATYFW